MKITVEITKSQLNHRNLVQRKLCVANPSTLPYARSTSSRPSRRGSVWLL